MSIYIQHFKFSLGAFLEPLEDLKSRTLDPYGFGYCFYAGDYEPAYSSPRSEHTEALL